VEALPAIEDLSFQEENFLEQVYSMSRLDVQINIDAALDHLCELGPTFIDFYSNVIHIASKEEAIEVFKRTRGQTNLSWRKCRQARVHILPVPLYFPPPHNRSYEL